MSANLFIEKYKKKSKYNLFIDNALYRSSLTYSKPVLLDLFCGAGGAAMGYHRAGFDVIGVDIKPQPHYPFEFWQADALQILDGLIVRLIRRRDLGFSAIHASPPCQKWTKAQYARKNSGAHHDFITPLRPLFRRIYYKFGINYVIENVEGAPLCNPIMLCGTSFKLYHDGFELRRHRLFECSFSIQRIAKCNHSFPAAPVFGCSAGRDFRRRYGRDFGADAKRAIMGIDWMSTTEVSQAIPPIFTEYIGQQLMYKLYEQSKYNLFTKKFRHINKRNLEMV